MLTGPPTELAAPAKASTTSTSATSTTTTASVVGNASQPIVVDRGIPGDRLRRLAQRRRLMREEMLVVAALLLILTATVAILATQWLASGPSAAAVHFYTHLDPGGTT